MSYRTHIIIFLLSSFFITGCGRSITLADTPVGINSPIVNPPDNLTSTDYQARDEENAPFGKGLSRF